MEKENVIHTCHDTVHTMDYYSAIKRIEILSFAIMYLLFLLTSSPLSLF
jgi:hypothetical protein